MGTVQAVVLMFQLGGYTAKLGTGVEENQEENVLEEVFLYLFRDSSSPREFQGEPQDQTKKMRWLQKGEISNYLCVWKIVLGGSFPCIF